MIPSRRRTSSTYKKMRGKRDSYYVFDFGLRVPWKYGLALLLLLLLLAIGIIGWWWNIASVQDKEGLKHQLPARSLLNKIPAKSLSKEIPVISKPEFLYLVGVEGSSHHGVFDILAGLGADRCRVQHYPDLEGESRNL